MKTKRLAVSTAFVVIIAIVILLLILFFQSGVIYKLIPPVLDLFHLSKSTISRVNQTINETIILQTS